HPVRSPVGRVRNRFLLWSAERDHNRRLPVLDCSPSVQHSAVSHIVQLSHHRYSAHPMILPPINEADLISENAAPAPDVFEGVPDAVHPRLKLLNPSKAREIDQAFTKFQYEPDRRALAPGDFDFFSLPGKYRKIEHLLVIRSQPPDEVS